MSADHYCDKAGITCTTKGTCDQHGCARAPREDDAEMPPWLLHGDVAVRIANEHRVRAGAVQAIAKAVFDELFARHIDAVLEAMPRSARNRTSPENARDVIDAAKSLLRQGSDPWQPIETAPPSGVILLKVEDAAGERRTFVAEFSSGDSEGYWMVTHGWTGWTRLHSAWKPALWRRLP